MESLIPEYDIPGLSIGAEFTLEVFDTNGVVETIGPIKNMVLDCGLLALDTHTLAAMITYVNVGTSSAPPEPTQTGLQNRLYSTNNVFNSQSAAYYSNYPVYRGFKRVFQFDVGTCTGDLTEVGMSRLNNSGYFNRQLFKNSLGYDIIVRINADQGLRVTCDLKIYPEPDVKAYSQIYSYFLNGATSGSLTLTNGVTTKTFSYTQLTTVGTMKLELENWLGIGSVCNVTLVDNKYYIFAHLLNTADLNLAIDSHTLTGGAGSPNLTVHQPYSDCVIEDSFVLTDGVLGTTPTKNTKKHWLTYIGGMDKLTMKLAAASTTQYSGWGYFEGSNITATVFGNLAIAAITQAGTLPTPSFTTKTKTPTTDSVSWIKRAYYAPGDLGTGDQVVVGFVCVVGNIMACSIIKLDEPITVAAGEEFEFNFEFKWGRI